MSPSRFNVGGVEVLLGVICSNHVNIPPPEDKDELAELLDYLYNQCYMLNFTSRISTMGIVSVYVHDFRQGTNIQ